MKEKLTRKQKKFCNDVAVTNKIGESALTAGYGHPEYGSTLMAMPKIQNEIQRCLEKAGITDSAIAKRIKEGFGSFKVQYNPEGFREEIPDFGIRAKYIEMAIRLKNLEPAKRIQVEDKKITIIIDAAMIANLTRAKELTMQEQKELSGEIVEGELLDENQNES